MRKMKKLIFAVLIVCLMSSTSFAFLPAILAGMTLAEALMGTTVLSIIAADSAYIISKSNLTIADISPTIGFIQRFGTVLWTDKSIPSAPLTKSAPVVVDIPIATVKTAVSSAKATYPKLYSAFYTETVQPYDFQIGTSYYANSGALTGPWCSQFSTMQDPWYSGTYITYHVAHSSCATGYAYYHQVATPVFPVVTPKTLPSSVPLDSTYAAELDNLIIQNQESLVTVAQDTGIGLNNDDLVGSGVTALGDATSAGALTVSDIASGVTQALGSSTVPNSGFYDTGIVAPDKKEIGGLLSSLFSNSPLTGMIRGFTLSTTEQTAIVNCGTVYGKEFVFDFTRWISFMSACGSLLLVIVHGFAIMIIVKGWK